MEGLLKCRATLLHLLLLHLLLPQTSPQGLFLSKPPLCYCQGRTFDLLASIGGTRDRCEMVWKELGYCLVLARLAPRLLLWADPGRRGRWGSAHYSLAITANSHQGDVASGCTLVWMCRAAFLALGKVFPHSKEFTTPLDTAGKGKVREALCKCSTDVLKFVQQACNRTRICNFNSCISCLPLNHQAVLCPCAMTDRHVAGRAICIGQENAVYPAPESQNSIFIRKFCDRKRFCECQHFHIITIYT